MPGPLPQADKRRRNAATIPTTALPANGRSGKTPVVPVGYELGREGKAWWEWAWATPQAAAWGDGSTYVVARRASLEDDVAALARVEGLDLDELRAAETQADFRFLVQRIAGLATGRVALMKEMREIDDRLGLTPKAMAALRWTVVADGDEKPAGKGKDKGAATYGHLRTVG